MSISASYVIWLVPLELCFLRVYRPSFVRWVTFINMSPISKFPKTYRYRIVGNFVRRYLWISRPYIVIAIKKVCANKMPASHVKPNVLYKLVLSRAMLILTSDSLIYGCIYTWHDIYESKYIEWWTRFLNEASSDLLLGGEVFDQD